MLSFIKREFKQELPIYPWDKFDFGAQPQFPFDSQGSFS